MEKMTTEAEEIDFDTTLWSLTLHCGVFFAFLHVGICKPLAWRARRQRSAIAVTQNNKQRTTIIFLSIIILSRSDCLVKDSRSSE